VLLVAINATAWAYALITLHAASLPIGTAAVAYFLGLRHAVDADHIAAIDNVTRRLMQEGKRSETSGLFFSLGHSSVVLLASLAFAFGALALRWTTNFESLGGLVETAVSAGFLLMIAVANSFVFARIWRAWRQARIGQALEKQIDELVVTGGPMTGAFRRVFTLIRASWHMFPLGFLFGLGFDTATEIALLAISASGASHGLTTASILAFPLLFASGMMLVDTLDSILMTGAYGWAFASPGRKLAYNMTVTLISVIVASATASIEILGLGAGRLKLSGGFWSPIGTLSNHMGLLGAGIILAFALLWFAAFVLYRPRETRSDVHALAVAQPERS
jgi:high-affinity nickel-transport protein